MSADVQVGSKVEMSSDKQSKRRTKDSEKTHHRRPNFSNRKFKHDYKFRKRTQCFNGISGKFFPPYKMRKKDFIIPPTKFLLGGNINDPLNLNSLQDEEINRAMNAVTPKSSPLPTPKHRRGEIEVIIPPDITDPLNLTAGDDDAAYEAMLTSPVKKTQKKQKKNKKTKRKTHRSSSGVGSGKEDSIEGAKLDTSDPSVIKGEMKKASAEGAEKEIPHEKETLVQAKEQGPPAKRHKPDGSNPRASLRKMELKERKADLDKIVSPVIPQPGAWNDRHRFRPPPQRTPQLNKSQKSPTFKETNAKFQYGNYNRYYGYRNPNQAVDIRLKVLEKHKYLFRGKDVLDIGCNSGHLTLAIARDFEPNKVVGLDIDRQLINMARTNIKHYVNCGKKDKFFPVSMPIVYGPIDVPSVSGNKAFPQNISFIQGNYVLDSDIQLSMEQPQFDVILCLSITKWIQLNWGDAGLKRAFKRMFGQLRPGGILILEAQAWASYKKKKKLTPEIWRNYHTIELFPHQFSQFLMSEVGFSRTEVLGSPLHQAQGFQRPIKMFIKEDPSFDTPGYSVNTPVCDSLTPRYCTPGRLNLGSSGSYSYRMPDGQFQDDSSRDSNFPYGTPNSSESGFSETLHPRRYIPPIRFVAVLSESDPPAGTLQSQKESPTELERNSAAENSASTSNFERSEHQDSAMHWSVLKPEQEIKDNIRKENETTETLIQDKLIFEHKGEKEQSVKTSMRPMEISVDINKGDSDKRSTQSSDLHLIENPNIIEDQTSETQCSLTTMSEDEIQVKGLRSSVNEKEMDNKLQLGFVEHGTEDKEHVASNDNHKMEDKEHKDSSNIKQDMMASKVQNVSNDRDQVGGLEQEIKDDELYGTEATIDSTQSVISELDDKDRLRERCSSDYPDNQRIEGNNTLP